MPKSPQGSRPGLNGSPGTLLAAFLLAAAALAAPGRAAEPRWTPVGPPAGPVAARLFLDPQSAERQYALTAAGLWRSADGGNQWHAIQAGLDWPPLAFAIDPAHPSRLYVSVVAPDNSDSILRSDDYGNHWRTIFHSPTGDPVNSQDLQVDPFAADGLYWMQGQFLYRSQDGGASWSCVKVGDQCPEVSSFALAPDRPQTVYLVSFNGLAKTGDGGQTWTQTVLTASGISPDALVVTAALPATKGVTIYAWSRDPFARGEIAPCFARSDDDGATWHAVLHPATCGAPAVDPADPRTVRITVVEAGAPQLWVSHDGGELWPGRAAVPTIGDLYLTPAKGLVLATAETAGSGLFRSPGDQGPWRPANRGFAASEVNAFLPLEHGLLASPDEQLAVSRFPAVSLMKSGDGGRTWIDVPVTNPGALGGSLADPRHLVVAAVRYEPYVLHYRVLESLDEGASWHGVVDPQLDAPPLVNLAIDTADPRTFYGGTFYGGFYRSVDGGGTWQAANSGLPIKTHCNLFGCLTNQVHTILTDPKEGRHLLIHFEQQVYESVNGGESWTLRGPQLAHSNVAVQALARDSAGTLFVVGSGATADVGRLGVVYRSTDGGLTWTRAGRLPRLSDLGANPRLTGFVANAAGLFAGTTTTGVLWSRDGGNVWTPLAGGLPYRAVSALFADSFDPRRVYATVHSNGVYALQVP
jgi:photosystem II stability/assembly factor-like uncharacterized protein